MTRRDADRETMKRNTDILMAEMTRRDADRVTADKKRDADNKKRDADIAQLKVDNANQVRIARGAADPWTGEVSFH